MHIHQYHAPSPNPSPTTSQAEFHLNRLLHKLQTHSHLYGIDEQEINDFIPFYNILVLPAEADETFIIIIIIIIFVIFLFSLHLNN